MAKIQSKRWRYCVLWSLLLACSGCTPVNPARKRPKAEAIDCRSEVSGGVSPGTYSATEPVLDLQGFSGQLYITGDAQGAWQPWLASLLAAKLVQVQHQGSALSVRDVLSIPTLHGLGRINAPERGEGAVYPEDLQIVWQHIEAEQQPPAAPPLPLDPLVIQIGDLIHGAKDSEADPDKASSDGIGSVRLARRLQESAGSVTLQHRRTGKLTLVPRLLTLLGNHDYSFLTAPMMKSFASLQRDSADVCRELWAEDAPFGQYLRGLPVALRLGRVFISHTGFAGRGSETYAAGCGGTRDDDLISRLNTAIRRFLDALPEAHAGLFELRAQGGGDSLSKNGGILGEERWFFRNSWEPLGKPMSLRPWPLWLQDYFGALHVDAIVFGHSSRPFTGSRKLESPVVSARTVPQHKTPLGQSGALYGADVAMFKWREQPPTHWMLRCDVWHNGECAKWSRLQLIDRATSKPLEAGWQWTEEGERSGSEIAGVWTDGWPDRTALGTRPDLEVQPWP